MKLGILDIQHNLSGMFEIYGNLVPDRRLHLAQPPIRTLRVADIRARNKVEVQRKTVLSRVGDRRARQVGKLREP